MKCRHCQAALSLPFLDLGAAPHSNAYLTESALHAPEAWYPLRVLVCTSCWLVQTEDVVDAEALFNRDYAYFSSYSDTWLKHAEAYVALMVERFGLERDSLVVELAANDGYLLQYVQQRGIPCLGIEPTASTAAVARGKGIEVIEAFFGEKLGRSLAQVQRSADLVAANNVLAHVPDINDFLRGIACVLKPAGVATFEFPHLLQLVENTQFDTIYHEHFSYLSMSALERILAANGLRAFDVESLTTHGGSLRVFAQRADTGVHEATERLTGCLAQELRAGMKGEAYYRSFQAEANRAKDAFLAFLLRAKESNQRVAAYGAAAKGNTLMNYAGVRGDLLPYVIDRNPSKQGKFMPGSRIPILSEGRLAQDRPDFVVILPWNLREEIMKQLDYIRAWGGRFVTAIPRLDIC